MKKIFNLDIRCQCYITFPLSLMTRPNKLEGLSLETLSSQILEFEGQARANPIGAPFRCFLLGQDSVVTSKCQTRMESDYNLQTLQLIWPHHQSRRQQRYEILTSGETVERDECHLLRHVAHRRRRAEDIQPRLARQRHHQRRLAQSSNQVRES